MLGLGSLNSYMMKYSPPITDPAVIFAGFNKPMADPKFHTLIFGQSLLGGAVGIVT